MSDLAEKLERPSATPGHRARHAALLVFYLAWCNSERKGIRHRVDP